MVYEQALYQLVFVKFQNYNIIIYYLDVMNVLYSVINLII